MREDDEFGVENPVALLIADGPVMLGICEKVAELHQGFLYGATHRPAVPELQRLGEPPVIGLEKRLSASLPLTCATYAFSSTMSFYVFLCGAGAAIPKNSLVRRARTNTHWTSGAA